MGLFYCEPNYHQHICQRITPERSVLSEEIHKRFKEWGIEEIFTLMRIHLCVLWTSLSVFYFHCPPSCWWVLKVFWNLPNLCRQEGSFESNHIPREMCDGNAFILQKTVSLSVHSLSSTPLPWIYIYTEILPLYQWQGSGSGGLVGFKRPIVYR